MEELHGESLSLGLWRHSVKTMFFLLRQMKMAFLTTHSLPADYRNLSMQLHLGGAPTKTR